MIKKCTLLFGLILFVTAIAGCGTAKGAARATMQGTKKVCKVPAHVAKKSWQAAKMGATKSWEALEKTDNFVQKHLW